MTTAQIESEVVHATVRESQDDKGYVVWDIECWFKDGQKYAAVQVDGDCLHLAQRIAKHLSEFQDD